MRVRSQDQDPGRLPCPSFLFALPRMKEEGRMGGPGEHGLARRATMRLSREEEPRGGCCVARLWLGAVRWLG